MEVFDWPSQSPNLNLMDLLWQEPKLSVRLLGNYSYGWVEVLLHCSVMLFFVMPPVVFLYCVFGAKTKIDVIVAENIKFGFLRQQHIPPHISCNLKNSLL